MRYLAFPALLLLAFSCARGASKTAAAAAAPQQDSELRTIDTVPPRPAVIDPPPMLKDEAPPPKPKAMPWEEPKTVALSPDDERVRASLPFAPAIAMDPIDGSKISIRASTPTYEYKGRIFYFSSEANKQTFASSPDQYIKGTFTHL